MLAAIAAEIDRFYREGKAAEFRANILRFRERFTWERMIGNFRSLYDRIAGRNRDKSVKRLAVVLK